LWPCSSDDMWTESVIPTETDIIIHLYILHELIKRKVNWIGHILRRNCLLRQVIEGKIKGGIEVTGRRRRRRHRKLLNDLKERREHSHMKEEAVDRTTRT
jgi:hypothetical protein